MKKLILRDLLWAIEHVEDASGAALTRVYLAPTYRGLVVCGQKSNEIIFSFDDIPQFIQWVRDRVTTA